MIRPGAEGPSAERGTAALPLPQGEPDLLRRAAQRIGSIGAAADRTATVRGALAPLLTEVWTGAAAQQAITEARILGERSRRLVGALPSAERVLTRYAAALDETRQTTRRLQSRWDAAQDDYDGDRHRLDVVQASTGLDQSSAMRDLAERHRTVQARLAQRHTSCGESLRVAARDAQSGLLTLAEATLPARGLPTAGSMRAALTGDLGFPAGAERAEAARRTGLDAAVVWRRVMAPGRAADAEVDTLVALLGTVAANPLAAQAFLDEVGVEHVEEALADVSRPGSTGSLETARSLAATLGSVVVSATAPSDIDADPRTAQQLASGAALLQDEVVRSVAAVVTAGEGQHDSGYWLLGQLLVGARGSGATTRLPAGFARRLVAATAAAEVARSRDARFVGRHGSTREADGDRQFASLFEDGDRTGDALHVLLHEASLSVEDADDVARLLATTVEGPLRNGRDEPAVLAEYLVRRWVTHTVTSPQAPTDLELVTNADLGHLMAALGSGPEAAALRSRVMIEVGRTSELAQREWSTILQYEANSAAIESSALDWLQRMPESVAVSLRGLPLERPPVDGIVGGYAVPVGQDVQPLLANRELAGLVGAFAVGHDFGAGAKEPDAAYEQLIAGEVARLTDEVRAGLDPDDALLRLGFYHGSGSAALMSVAERQDRLNQEMWRNLANAKNLAVGPDRLDNAIALVTDGTNRTALDDFVIATVRSEEAIRQAEANEARLAALLGTVAPLLPGARSCAPYGTSQLTPLARGTALAPASVSAAELRQARQQEVETAFRAVAKEGVQEHLKKVRDAHRKSIDDDLRVWQDIADSQRSRPDRRP
ncbi:MAG: hypothetical protein L0H79_06000 [Intrasporangium sp.]|uniref:hypothetical protein n=1 Tax=Intrasporangium sp. TaxID=1925024 RepID=UPI0026475C15|nr:hypothetical protein [Intrasporangium sp.]MDN5795291.1 hypothetical protein [Intrasporangium sp.]